MKAQKLITTLATSAAILSANTQASDAIGPGDSESRWILGASVVAQNNIYAGEDAVGYISPNFVYNGDRFFVKNGTLNLFVAEVNQFSAGLIVGVDGGYLSDEDEYEDTDELEGLIERDATLEGGFYVNHTTDLGRLNLTVVTDLGNEHDGETVSLGYTFDLHAGEWAINPVVKVSWMSDSKVNHHVGVSASEATATRAEYRADSAVNVYAGVRGRYEFTENWDISLETGVTYLDSTIRDSSIVEDDLIYQAGVTVSYNF
ncbi:MAG: MipA/OmpV family protein [Halioglobus sp.]